LAGTPHESATKRYCKERDATAGRRAKSARGRGGLDPYRGHNCRASRASKLDRTRPAGEHGVARHRTDAEIEAGTVDYAIDGVDPAHAARLAGRYGPGSKAATKGRQQFFVDPLVGLDFLQLNTHRPLFRDLRLRQAVNYAIDRRALARLGSPFGYPLRPIDVPPARHIWIQGPQHLPVQPCRRQGAPAGGTQTQNRSVLHLQPVALRPVGADRKEQPRGDRDRCPGQGVSPRRTVRTDSGEGRAVRPLLERVGCGLSRPLQLS
jgi:Bacterial extracellular solute-binding proteins, family 5 Middle